MLQLGKDRVQLRERVLQLGKKELIRMEKVDTDPSQGEVHGTGRAESRKGKGGDVKSNTGVRGQ